MAQPYVGEVRMFAGNFAPAGWQMCDGTSLPISEYETLFQLIGTTYGGDGESTFNVPDLRGRMPVHQGQAVGGLNLYQLGEQAGVERVQLSTNQMPTHTHAFRANTASGHLSQPQGAYLAANRDYMTLHTNPGTDSMSSSATLPVGASEPHENMPPYLAVNFIISLYGIFPTPG